MSGIVLQSTSPWGLFDRTPPRCTRETMCCLHGAILNISRGVSCIPAPKNSAVLGGTYVRSDRKSRQVFQFIVSGYNGFPSLLKHVIRRGPPRRNVAFV